jgi:exopolyphosphatase / guanosine-5'-triphosphate,3'-diphosphate pyrophosphatase
LLGTSGTVTTIAGVHLNLPRYDRRQIDGLWLTSGEVDATITRLRSMSYAQRSANPCIGHERADLVLAGCAILEAIRQSFPAQRVRIADRGLREGILTQLMSADRVGARTGRMDC